MFAIYAKLLYINDFSDKVNHAYSHIMNDSIICMWQLYCRVIIVQNHVIATLLV